MNEEFFFTLGLTENEHFIVEDMISEECKRLGMELRYYRKFKQGHVPMQREVKVVGTPSQISDLKKFFETEHIHPANYHASAKEADLLLKEGKISFEDYIKKLRAA